jgi:hypothetical protein
MRRHVALVRTEVSEECIASIIRMIRIGELGTTLAVTSNRITLLRNVNYMRTEPFEWVTSARVEEGGGLLSS